MLSFELYHDGNAKIYFTPRDVVTAVESWTHSETASKPVTMLKFANNAAITVCGHVAEKIFAEKEEPTP